MRREVLVVGKFLAGAPTTVVVFGAGIVASFSLTYLHFDAGRDFVLNGPGPRPPPGVLLVAVLARLGYGAVLLAMSLPSLFTVVAEPTPPWLAVSGLLVFAGLVLACACWRVRRLEVLYRSERRSEPRPVRTPCE